MKRHFEGLPTHDDFMLVEEDIPELKSGGYFSQPIVLNYFLKSNFFPEFLVEAQFFSVDPYMRPYSKVLLSEMQTMIGSQVGR